MQSIQEERYGIRLQLPSKDAHVPASIELDPEKEFKVSCKKETSTRSTGGLSCTSPFSSLPFFQAALDAFEGRDWNAEDEAAAEAKSLLVATPISDTGSENAASKSMSTEDKTATSRSTKPTGKRKRKTNLLNDWMMN
jgi:hypothetical protein